MTSTRASSGLFLGVALLALLAACSGQSPLEPKELPAEFVGHRIFVLPVLARGDTLRFLADTGGIGFLTTGTAAKLELSPESTVVPLIQRDTSFNVTISVVKLPPYKSGVSIPALPIRGDVFSVGLGGRFRVLPYDRHGELNDQVIADGMLGQLWFSERKWTFDYPTGRLLLHPPGTTGLRKAEHTVHLGFQTDAAGKRLWNWPSIEATIAGEMIPFLFDTGATVVVSQKTLAVLNEGDSVVQATSFVAASLFDRWREDHPEWRVIERAERGGFGTMIEVPEVTIAGHAVGPVWFTRRPNRGFYEYLSSRMDRRVEGALGGTLLQYFKVTVDYPSAVATFERAPEQVQ